MAGTRNGDSKTLMPSSLWGKGVVSLLLLLSCRDRAARARSLRGVTDVDRTGTLLTPHSSTGFDKLDKAWMNPPRCFVGVGVGDASDLGCDMVVKRSAKGAGVA